MVVNAWSEQEKLSQIDLFPPNLRRKLVIALGTFEKVFCIVVLNRCQRVVIIHVRDRKPDPSHFPSRIHVCTRYNTKCEPYRGAVGTGEK